MVKATPPNVLIKFQGRRDWPLDPGLDDWGLNAEQQESYVEQFRRILAAKNAWTEEVDYFTLRRFLRARTYDLEKATTMWMNHLAWKSEFKVDTILQDFYFDERDQFLVCYPQGYHKIDKVGRPIYIQLLGQVNVDMMRKTTTEERMIKYHIQVLRSKAQHNPTQYHVEQLSSVFHVSCWACIAPVQCIPSSCRKEYERCVKVILPICSRLANRNIDQTFGIMDVKGVGLGHLTGEVKRLLSLITKYDQDNYPEMLGHICIINAPTVFRWVWAVVKNMIDPRTQSKIEILGTDYVPGLLKHMDMDALPEWLGGTSRGSLIDDVGPWSDPGLVASIGLDMEELRRGRRPPPPSAVLPAPAPALATLAGAQRRSFQHASGANSVVAPASVASGGGSIAGDLGRHSDLGRVQSGFETWHSPMQSTDFTGDLGVVRQPRFTGGVGLEEALLDDVARRRASMEHAAVGPGNGVQAILPIPETSQGAAGGLQRSLAERVAVLEKALPPHLARLQGAGAQGANQAAGAGAGGARSAPEGSLLYRVEVLEEAMDLLVAAQQAALEHQQQQAAKAAAAAKAAQQQPKPRECCCVVM